MRSADCRAASGGLATRTVVAHHGPHSARKPVPKPWLVTETGRANGLSTGLDRTPRSWPSPRSTGHRRIRCSDQPRRHQPTPQHHPFASFKTGEGGPRTVAHQIRRLELNSCSGRLTIDGWEGLRSRRSGSAHSTQNRMRIDHPDDHPVDRSASFWIRPDRHGTQCEQGEPDQCRPVRREASGS